MDQKMRIILSATMLLVLGISLAVTSFFKIYDYGNTIVPTSGMLPIQANSSADFYFWGLFGAIPHSERILVVISGSEQLQALLNSLSNYNFTMRSGQNITISLVSGNDAIPTTVMSAYSITRGDTIALYTLEVPADWWVYYIRVTNPESYPVCWNVNVVLYGQTINNTWLTLLIVGIVIATLGLALLIVGKSKSVSEKKET